MSNWTGRDGPAGRVRLLDRLVDVLDQHVAQPVGRRGAFRRRAEAAVDLSADRDHRVVGLTGLEDLGAPAEKLRVELLRFRGVGRNLIVPDEGPDPCLDGAHLALDLLYSLVGEATNGLA